ncbi:MULTISPECIES: adenosylcobinamide-phosphate synthase CbiB [unclassified Variovorax]|uniref:adenosylcobinamide-phosphate synthase CbiB n=1 Tax=unclassified Variovorax TaxID=663243 RepID=UPI00076D9007|nr:MULTISPECIES: adenosylcobinamide-phosphate synthase CbiB [unclassified Variovorax]KWT89404.1 Adenosylcobinamide-phosphate synthase [Variovorax sp. WDL1]PNG56582.1 Cobalamin biosynthesis protein CobD [Variovorax sp. B4]PNG58006.1 Cobalamin biosynthesis protein CobD [Variovorax sp. B2]VTV09516.1 cobalamin biosynthesis protein [Variovorax sp. WDL1]
MPWLWLPPALGEGWGGGSTALAHAAALVFALLVDRMVGEPPARWHPVVWMGRYLAWTGRRIAPPIDAACRRCGPFAAGALAWCAGAAAVVLAAAMLGAAAARLPSWAAALVLGLALKPLLAWRMLRDEVLAVEAALACSLAEGRNRLAHLVSRDVLTLDAGAVRESAIESLAENLNDSVVAPLFWFVLLGLPGAALYRFANTADAMWGYRGERHGRTWEWAGKWAARADDVLSWLPARITAFLLIVSCSPSGVRGRVGMRVLRSLPRESRRTPSPNSGWPMAAMALLLGVRLAKPGVYVLNAAGCEPLAADTGHAATLGARVVWLTAALAAIALLLLAAWRTP